MVRRFAPLVLLFGMGVPVPDLALAQALESDTSVIAAAVRQRGFICDDPQPPTPDYETSSPDEPAWLLNCANGSYRVKFMGDTGAQVEPVIGN